VAVVVEQSPGRHDLFVDAGLRAGRPDGDAVLQDLCAGEAALDLGERARIQ
jgi:hypothetical protein